ncbi:hypothetical protein MBLNU13_g05218t1 [Cladosporium sp. NU13]
MANTDDPSPPIASNTTAANSLTAQSVFNWGDTPQSKNTSYYNRIKTHFFPAPKSIPRRSAIRTARAPVPSWKTSVKISLMHHVENIVKCIRVTLIRPRLIIMRPNDEALAGGDTVGSTSNTSNTGTGSGANTTLTTVNRVNWIHHVRFPRELRDEIYSYLLPFDILIRGGAFDASQLNNLLRINSRSSNEIRELMQNDYHHIFEFKSVTTMLNAFDSAPTTTLSPYKRLTIRFTSPYNGHTNIYGNNNGWHRTNICPTLHRYGDEVWFETGYTCPSCVKEPFAQRELNFARATLLGKFERLTALQLPRRVRTRTFVWRDAHMIPHFRAYRLGVSIHLPEEMHSSILINDADYEQEIWQPWKPALPNIFSTTLNQDCLDFVYVDVGNDNNDLAHGKWYSAAGTPRALGVQIDGDMTY